jgi:succinate dehydrogenase / fumarate reductase cytochrome b subunit
MSKSVLLKSSIAKKYWMALTGLFLCTFLVGHLAGNLQLVFSTGEEGKRAFNEYAYFMAHNPAIKLLSYVTYISILFHIVDGFMLTIQNKKARPVGYAYNKPGANSSMASRNMAVLGTLILVFLATHMANFWWKAKVSEDKFPLHVKEISFQQSNEMTGQVQKQTIKLYLTTAGNYVPVDGFIVKNKTELYEAQLNAQKVDLKMGEGYKDLHSLVFAFFGHDKTKQGFPINDLALAGLIFYVISMLVLGFHLWHGFSSAFQTLGVNHPTYTSWIKKLGYGFAILVPGLFALIPIVIFITK